MQSINADFQKHASNLETHLSGAVLALNSAICSARTVAAEASAVGHYDKAREAVYLARKLIEEAKLTSVQADRLQNILKIEGASSGPDADIQLRMKINDARARATISDGKITVLSGSTINLQTHPSLAPIALELRKKLLGNGSLSQNGAKTLLMHINQKFGSLSAAAQFVAGSSVSGPREWHLEETGQSFGEWEKGNIVPLDLTQLL